MQTAGAKTIVEARREAHRADQERIRAAGAAFDERAAAAEEARMAALPKPPEPDDGELAALALRDRVRAADPDGLNPELSLMRGELERKLRCYTYLREREHRAAIAAAKPRPPTQCPFPTTLGGLDWRMVVVRAQTSIEPNRRRLSVLVDNSEITTPYGVPIFFVPPELWSHVEGAIAERPWLAVFDGLERWDARAVLAAAGEAIESDGASTPVYADRLRRVRCLRTLVAMYRREQDRALGTRFGRVPTLDRDTPRGPLARELLDAAYFVQNNVTPGTSVAEAEAWWANQTKDAETTTAAP